MANLSTDDMAAFIKAEVLRSHELLDVAGVPREHNGEAMSLSQRVEALVKARLVLTRRID